MAYYTFKKYGKKPIHGPYRTRLEAKQHGPKTGQICRHCGFYSGGMTICYGCICACFNGGVELDKPTKPKKITFTTV